MCGLGAMLVPTLVGGIMQAVSGSTKSYTPDEIPLAATNPEPMVPEPTLGVDNTDGSKKAKQGRSALVIERNPSVGVAGGRSSGVNVAGG